MNAFISLFRSTALNSTQRVGKVCTLIAIVGIIFLHNPISGYSTGDGGFVTHEEDICGMELAMAARRSVQANDMSAQESQAAMAELTRLRKKCLVTVTSQAYERPFLQWSSKSPVVAWLGEIGNLISALIAAIVIGTIWIFVFAKSSDRDL